MASRDSNPILTHVQPGSRTDLDDADTDPYQLSHAVLSALSHGIDHFHCFRSLVLDAEALHIYAPFSLFRSALENICTALWLLEPSERAIRVQRRLQLAVADVRRRDEVQRLAGEHRPEVVERSLDRIAQVAVAAGATKGDVLGRTPSFERIVSEAAAATTFSDHTAVLLWKTCSAITHGQQWASLAILSREVQDDPDAAGIVRMQLAAPERTVILIAQSVALMARDAWALYDRHRLAWTDHARPS